MTWQDFDAWSERSVHGFADQQVAAGLTSAPAALRYAREQLAAQLPDGLATPGHRLWMVHLADEGPPTSGPPNPLPSDPRHHPGVAAADRPAPAVGALWLRVRPTRDGVEATVLDIEVAEALRGRGLGRATMLAAMRAAADLGASVVRLTVFGHNQAALSLYRGLGFAVERALLSRDLRAAPGQHPGATGLTMTPLGEADQARLRHAAGNRRPGPPASGPADHCWSAWDGARQVGWLRLQVDRAGEALGDDERRVGIVDLQVLPDVRGRGHGRALVRVAEQEARALGAATLTVTLTGGDTTLRGFYERSAFVLTAQLMSRPVAGTPAEPRSPSTWPSG